MTQYGYQDEMQIRTALITTPFYDHSCVAYLVRTLYVQKNLKLIILEYKQRSLFFHNFRYSITGLLIAGLIADQFIKYECSEIQVYCREYFEKFGRPAMKGSKSWD
jgi:hypothetical protein